MVFNKKFRFLVLLVLLISFFSNITLAAFPSLDFSTTNFPQGQVDISGKISSGVELELYVNNNYIGKQNILAPIFIINLTNEISNIQSPLGAVTRFVNSNPSKIFIINITGVETKTLNYGETYDIQSFDEGSIIFRNEAAGVQKNILFTDTLINFTFSDITQSYLLNGENNIQFILKHSRDKDILDSFNYSINYEKYSNTITLTNFINVTNMREINIEGFTSDSTSPLKYISNYNGIISNLGLLNNIVKQNNRFNVTIPSLIEGENSIRFITLNNDNNDIFNGEKIVKILVDTIPPTIDILSATYDSKNINNQQIKKNADFTQENIFMNGNSLNLNISTDSERINYTFNNKNESCGLVVNQTIECNFNLVEGQNNLTLIGIDIAGNIVMQAHAIHFSDKPISLNKQKLEPKEGSTVNFFLQDITGIVNKPDVTITAFTMPTNSKYFYTDQNGVQQQSTATCKDFEISGGARDVGSIDRTATSQQLDLQDKQINLLDTFSSILGNKASVTSDSNGNFVLKNIILTEKSLDNQNINSNQVSKVNSPNTICFIMTDKYGNVASETLGLTLDQGNTMWIEQEVTPTPSTIYAAEIEQTGDVRSGTGNVRVGIIARLHYTGGSKVKTLSQPRVSVNPSLNPELSRYARVVISEMNYMLDKNANDMVIYFPVEIMPMNKKPLDYPKDLKLGFQVMLTYDLEDTQVPIDTANPVYFQTSLNIERPLDSAKWLSPSMINDGISFLNKSIEYTKKAAEYTGIAATIGVLSCTGAKFYYGALIASADDEETKNDYKEKLYLICDRVVCSATPNQCNEGTNYFGETTGVLNTTGKTIFNSGELLNEGSIYSTDENNNKKLAQFDSLSLGKPCDFIGANGTKMPGVLINGVVTKYDKADTNWIIDGKSSSTRIANQCAPAQYYNGNIPVTDISKINSSTMMGKVNLAAASGACYTPKSPRFDDARSWPYENTNNPKDNIIESVRGGCITDTYSHLKNYLQIQEAIKGCLEQAKIGVTKGSYCERLMSQAVCDIATNVLFKTIAEKSKTTTPETHDTGLVGLLQGAKQGDELLNNRYDGNSFFSQAGLGTEQIVNNVCLAAFTGDWSILSQNILSALDKNEIEPTFGPMFPESRMQGYNPLTGDLSIRYMFTYAGVSGGQIVNSKVELLCDKSKKGGDYCPEGVINSIEGGSNFNAPRLVIQKGNSRQDSIILTDSKARFRYNIVRITHTYQLNKENKIEIQEEEIFHKDSSLLASCNWNAGILGTGLANDNLGISCTAMFGPESLVSLYTISDLKTKLVPTQSGGNPTYYPGNKVLVDLSYDVRDTNLQGEQLKLKLFYKAYCSADVVPAFSSVDVNILSGSITGHALVPTVTIPEFGQTTATKGSYTSYIDLTKDVVIKEIKVKNFASSGTQASGSFRIMKILVNGEEKQSSEVLFNVVDGKLTNPTQFIKPEWLKNSDKPSKVKIYLDRETKTIEITLVLEDNSEKLFSVPQEQTGSTSTTDLQNVQSSNPCSIEMRLLPANTDLSLAEFNNYNSNTDNIQTNVGKNEIVKKTFYVKDTPTDNHQLNIEVVSPINNANFCIDNGSNTIIPIDIAMISSDKAFEYSLENSNFEFKLALDRYVNTFDQKDLNCDKDTNICSDKKTFTLKDIDFSTSQSGKLYVNYDDQKDSQDKTKIKNINKVININLNKCN